MKIVKEMHAQIMKNVDNVQTTTSASFRNKNETCCAPSERGYLTCKMN